MSDDLTVDPSIGLPAGRPVIGSVPDGVRLPYELDLGDRSTARLVLTLDGVTASDEEGGASGTLRVPANDASLTLSDLVQVELTALDLSSGDMIASASMLARVSDGARVPASPALSVANVRREVHDGDTVTINAGDSIDLQAVVSSGTDSIRLTGYDLTVDDESILVDPKPDSLGNSQWVQGAWTAPADGADHTLILWASVEGTEAVQSTTLVLTPQAGGTLSWDNPAGDVDLGAGVDLTGTLKLTESFTPVAAAVIDVTWVADGDTTWTPVGTATTDASGRFSLHVAPLMTGKFLAHTAGVSGVVGDTQSGTLAIGVRPNVVLAVDRVAIKKGEAFAFTVTAPAQMAGVNTLLQLWNGVCWSTVAWAPLTTTGSARFRFVPPAAGSYRFGALTSYFQAYPPTPSSDLSVTVR